MKVEKLSKLHNTSSFDCGDEDINEFLKEDALKWQEKNLAVTNIFIYNEELIGFFCSSGDSIKLKTNEKKESDIEGKPIREIPAIKLGRLGRNKKFAGQGVGSNILKWAIGYVKSLAERTGIRYITVDAYYKKVDWYQKLGFVKNLHEDYIERENVSMRYDLHNPPKN